MQNTLDKLDMYLRVSGLRRAYESLLLPEDWVFYWYHNGTTLPFSKREVATTLEEIGLPDKSIDQYNHTQVVWMNDLYKVLTGDLYIERYSK